MEHIYKDVIYKEHSELSMIELNLFDNNFKKDFDYVLKMPIFLELIGYRRPKYVLFNKSKSDFEISEKLNEFSQHQVIDMLFTYGVKKIYFLAPTEKIGFYNKKFHNKNVFTFTLKSEIVNHIKNIQD